MGYFDDRKSDPILIQNIPKGENLIKVYVIPEKYEPSREEHQQRTSHTIQQLLSIHMQVFVPVKSYGIIYKHYFHNTNMNQGRKGSENQIVQS